jgi:HEPN domain-containing protein
MKELVSMTPRRDRHFQKSYAAELIGIAAGDLESAKGLLVAKRGRPENICYLAEQCIEKALKAMLVHLEKPVPITHDLGIISERVQQYLPIEVHTDLTLYTEFATTRRYEESALILTQEDLEAAIEVAENLLLWVRSKML